MRTVFLAGWDSENETLFAGQAQYLPTVTVRVTGVVKLVRMDVSKDRYCSPNVTLETASAFYVELEPFVDMRTQFMFWMGDAIPADLKIPGQRIRDLRPGDEVEFQGFRRKISSVMIYR